MSVRQDFLFFDYEPPSFIFKSMTTPLFYNFDMHPSFDCLRLLAFLRFRGYPFTWALFNELIG